MHEKQPEHMHGKSPDIARKPAGTMTKTGRMNWRRTPSDGIRLAISMAG
jgi:hypothetical protein